MPPGAADIDPADARRSPRPSPAVVLIIAGAEDAARLVARQSARTGSAPRHLRQPVHGPHAVSSNWPAPPPKASASRCCSCPDPADTDTAARFIERFTAEHHHPPDYTAALTYDATRLLIEAIRRAGPNRARIREALAQLSPWPGIAGPIHFDGTGQNTRTNLCMGTIRERRHRAVCLGPLDCREAHPTHDTASTCQRRERTSVHAPLTAQSLCCAVPALARWPPPGSRRRLRRAEPRVEFTPSADPVACYDFLEVDAERRRARRRSNPFTDVTVEGAFGLKGEKPLAVDGFCDSADGSVFRIRFMPSKPGAYDYTVKYREGAFEQTHQGRFQASDAKKKGLVRVDPEFPCALPMGRHQGTLFLERHHGLLAGRLGRRNHPPDHRPPGPPQGHPRPRRAERPRQGRPRLVRKRVSHRQVLLPASNPWVAKDPASLEKPGFDVTRFNVAYWQKWERLLEHARSKDMVVSVIFYVDGRRPGVDPFGKAGMGGPDEQRYYRYAVARLAPVLQRHVGHRQRIPPLPRRRLGREDGRVRQSSAILTTTSPRPTATAISASASRPGPTSPCTRAGTNTAATTSCCKNRAASRRRPAASSRR